MKEILILVISLFSINECFPAQWFCKEGSSKRFDNTFEVCGIGSDLNEDIARKKALSNAFNEFDLVCNKSDDCKGKYKQVSPLRTDCEKNSGKFNCYRAFYIVIDPTKTQINSENDFLSTELEKKEREIKEVQKKYGFIFSEKLRLENENKKLNIQNLELNKRIKDNETYINENKKLANRLIEVEKESKEIREKIKDKNKMVELYIKRGMTRKEVNKLLSISIKNSYYYTYGTYNIIFDYHQDIVKYVCDMSINVNSVDSYAQYCLNINP